MVASRLYIAQVREQLEAFRDGLDFLAGDDPLYRRSAATSVCDIRGCSGRKYAGWAVKTALDQAPRLLPGQTTSSEALRVDLGLHVASCEEKSIMLVKRESQRAIGLVLADGVQAQADITRQDYRLFHDDSDLSICTQTSSTEGKYVYLPDGTSTSESVTRAGVGRLTGVVQVETFLQTLQYEITGSLAVRATLL